MYIQHAHWPKSANALSKVGPFCTRSSPTAWWASACCVDVDVILINNAECSFYLMLVEHTRELSFAQLNQTKFRLPLLPCVERCSFECIENSLAIPCPHPFIFLSLYLTYSFKTVPRCTYAWFILNNQWDTYYAKINATNSTNLIWIALFIS